MEEKRKCIEVYIIKKQGEDNVQVQFKNIIKDTKENAEWFKCSSDIMKQLAYVLMKIYEKDTDTEVNNNDE